jgi:hypothetical protein
LVYWFRGTSACKATCIYLLLKKVKLGTYEILYATNHVWHRLYMVSLCPQ